MVLEFYSMDLTVFLHWSPSKPSFYIDILVFCVVGVAKVDTNTAVVYGPVSCVPTDVLRINHLVDGAVVIDDEMA